MQATKQEIITAEKIAEAVVEFLIAWEEGRRLRTPASAPPQVEVRLPDPPPPRPGRSEPPKDGKSLMPDQAQLLDLDKVAELLTCSSRHVYRLSDAGRMPRPRKIGSLV